MQSKRTRIFIVLMLVLALSVFAGTAWAQGPGGGGKGGGGGGHTEPVGNNLSYPALAADGFSIATVETPSFTVPYAGDYPGLTAEQIAYLQANGPWYPQKTEGNLWSAEFADYASEPVTFIDWGDNIESVNPMLRRPFRIEVRLFVEFATPMTAYTMAELEYPSSLDELQGTNTTTYDSDFATVVSSMPGFVIQSLGAAVPEGLTWDGTQWVSEGATYDIVPMAFGPELNVGGKYIFGGSQGGWKPTAEGYYRLTFYIPDASEIDLTSALIGNLADFETGATTEADEGGAATPVVDSENNLTYVDVLVVAGGGGGGGKK